MLGRCALEVWAGGRWRRAAELHVDDASAGTQSKSRLEYDLDYLDEHADALGAIDARAVSCRHPLGYEEARLDTWPAFVLDILPSGAARRVVAALDAQGLPAKRARKRLAALADSIGALDRTMRDEGVPKSVVSTLDRRIARVASDLARIR